MHFDQAELLMILGIDAVRLLNKHKLIKDDWFDLHRWWKVNPYVINELFPLLIYIEDFPEWMLKNNYWKRSYHRVMIIKFMKEAGRRFKSLN